MSGIRNILKPSARFGIFIFTYMIEFRYWVSNQKRKKNFEIIVLYFTFQNDVKTFKIFAHSIFASEYHPSFSSNQLVHLQASWIHSERFFYDMKKENIKRRLKWRTAGIETANQKEGQNTNWISFDFLY